MAGGEVSRRLVEHLARGYSAAALREAVRRELPEFVPDLPPEDCSVRTLAEHTVDYAERRGYLPEVALAALRPTRRPGSSLRAVLIGAAVVVLGVSFAGVSMMMQQPVESSLTVEQDRELEVLLPAPVTAPYARAPATVRSPPRRTGAVSRRGATGAPGVATVATGERGVEDLSTLEKVSPQEKRGSEEASSGLARCRGDRCTLTANGGHLLRSEVFCIEPPDGSEAWRCFIDGRLIEATSVVTCRFSEAGEGSRTGEFKWRRCD